MGEFFGAAECPVCAQSACSSDQPQTAAPAKIPARTLRGRSGPLAHPAMPKHIFVLTGAGVSAESGLGTFRDRGRGDLDAVRPDEARDARSLRARSRNRARLLRRTAAQPPEREAERRAFRAGAARRSARGGGRPPDAGHAEHRRSARAGGIAAGPAHARRAAEGALPALRFGSPLGRRSQAFARLPRLRPRGGLRPHVVWFGEMPFHLDDIERAMRSADLFVAIGTSGAVYPAAGFVAEARAYGVPTCEINLEAADNAFCFDEARYGPASETVPAWVEELLGGGTRSGWSRHLPARTASRPREWRMSQLLRRRRAGVAGGVGSRALAGIVARRPGRGTTGAAQRRPSSGRRRDKTSQRSDPAPCRFRPNAPGPRRRHASGRGSARACRTRPRPRWGRGRRRNAACPAP